RRASTPLFTYTTLFRSIIGVADLLKDSSKEAVLQLKKMGSETYMLTGDNQRTAKAIARQVGIENVIAEVLPEEKAGIIEKLKKGDRKSTRLNSSHVKIS